MINNKIYEKGSQEWLLNQIKLNGDNSNGGSTSNDVATETTLQSLSSKTDITNNHLSDIFGANATEILLLNEIRDRDDILVSNTSTTNELIIDNTTITNQGNAILNELKNYIKALTETTANLVIEVVDATSKTMILSGDTTTVVLPYNRNRKGFQIQADNDITLSFNSNANTNQGFLITKNKIYTHNSNVVTSSPISIYVPTTTTVQIIEF